MHGKQLLSMKCVLYVQHTLNYFHCFCTSTIKIVPVQTILYQFKNKLFQSKNWTTTYISAHIRRVLEEQLLNITEHSVRSWSSICCHNVTKFFDRYFSALAFGEVISYVLPLLLRTIRCPADYCFKGTRVFHLVDMSCLIKGVLQLVSRVENLLSVSPSSALIYFFLLP